MVFTLYNGRNILDYMLLYEGEYSLGRDGIMEEYSQQLKKEIKDKNLLLSSFNQNYDSDKILLQNIEVELDSLLYKYYKNYKMLKYTEE